MSWTPLLLGPLAERALETAEAIAVALAHPQSLEWLDAEAGGPQTPPAVDLAGGRTGLAIFFSYLGRCQPGAHARTALHLLDTAIAALETTAMSPSLYGGFTGVAWACRHLGDRDEDDDPNADVDAALLDYLRHTPWEDERDLVSGLVGLGVYALEHRPHPRADTILARVLDRLAEIAQSSGGGVTWQTPFALLPDEQRAACPDGYYNLGVAHGVPGVIAFLGYACGAGHDAAARPLLKRAVAWLLDQRLDPVASSVFPNWIAPGRAVTPARLAWCYGDAGVAAALLVAARGAGRPDWERVALAIARRATERSEATTGVRDACLCHGAAGLAHIFNRMYQATDETWLAEAARYWLTRTLNLRRPGEGVAGFLALGRDAEGNDLWRPEPGLLTGAAGIGLALLAACSVIEPAWDRTLLLSVPRARVT
jgi:hypothetical protein